MFWDTERTKEYRRQAGLNDRPAGRPDGWTGSKNRPKDRTSPGDRRVVPAGRDSLRSKRSGLIRIASALCAVLIAVLQCLTLWPAFAVDAYGETAGETLQVRVQYFGERGDLIREKARFSRGDLEALGAGTYYYSNVTRVGTVMSMAAYGPEVLTIIQAAGIDPGSVKLITFRATDGYTRNFTIEDHLSGGRYYYPELSSNYERNEEGTALTPLEGSLAGAREVPAILALTFGATKAPGARAEDLTQGTEETYRFCMGQTPLAEGRQTRPGQDGGDVSSLDSVHSIYGIDVTLKGSPVSGIGIDPVEGDLKVGSVTQLTVRIAGDELFADDFDQALGELTWTSSDPSIARVDDQGNVTILKKGRVTITVKAANGMKAKVTIDAGGGSDAEKKTEVRATRQTRQGSQPTPPPLISSGSLAQDPSQTAGQADVPKVHMREILLGNELTEEEPEEAQVQAVEEDTNILKEQKDYSTGTAAGAAGTALAACGVGGILRFRRYRLILKGWKR